MEKTNYIKIENIKGLKKEYRVLCKIETEEKNKTFIVYTDDKTNKKGLLVTYVTLYDGKKYKDPTDKEMEFIKTILNSLDKE